MKKEIFTNNLKLIRKQNGMLQIELAKIIGITEQTYINYEKGIRPIPSNILIQLSDIFQTSIDIILHGEIKYNPKAHFLEELEEKLENGVIEIYVSSHKETDIFLKNGYDLVGNVLTIQNCVQKIYRKITK